MATGEKPKEGEIVFGMISTGWVVAQYINGEFYVDDLHLAIELAV